MIAAQKHINKVNVYPVWFLFDVSNIRKVVEVVKWNNFNVLHLTGIIIHSNKTASIFGRTTHLIGPHPALTDLT